MAMYSHFRLTNNINLSGINWTPIPNFYGTLDGNNHHISTLTINATQTLPETYIGLFGVNRGTIQNLNIVGVQIFHDNGLQGIHTYVGVVCAINVGVIFNVVVTHANLTVRRTHSALGGIAGLNHHMISHATVAHATLESYGDVGGVAGQAYGGFILHSTVSHIHVRHGAVVLTDRAAGGFVGRGVDTTISSLTLIQTFVANFKNDGIPGLAPCMGIMIGYIQDSTLEFGAVNVFHLSAGTLSGSQLQFVGTHWGQMVGRPVGNVTIR